MDMNTYQQQASKTDQAPLTDESSAGPAMLIPLLGMAGEVGELLSEYKKFLRDGESHRLFKERVTEELGDLLWYVANVASKFGLQLDDIAQMNIDKCRDRWDDLTSVGGASGHFDTSYPPHEQLPRRFVFQISKGTVDGRVTVKVYIDGTEMTTDLSELTDNAYEDDGYRFHDVFHLSYAAVLGWSPIIRSGLKRKRKSVPKTDEVEDGGRAKAIEEGVSACVFSYAVEHNYLEGAEGVSYDLLRLVRKMTSHLEVSRRTAREWERAIMKGFEVWRTIRANGGGAILVDMDRRTIEVCDVSNGIPR